MFDRAGSKLGSSLAFDALQPTTTTHHHAINTRSLTLSSRSRTVIDWIHTVQVQALTVHRAEPEQTVQVLPQRLLNHHHHYHYLHSV